MLRLKCKYCNSLQLTIKSRRLLTNYENEEENYIISCLNCFNRMDDDVNEWRKEYYNSVI